MYLIKYNDNLINTYAYYFMNSSIFINQLLSKIASTTLQAVNKANFKSIENSSSHPLKNKENR